MNLVNQKQDGSKQRYPMEFHRGVPPFLSGFPDTLTPGNGGKSRNLMDRDLPPEANAANLAVLIVYLGIIATVQRRRNHGYIFRGASASSLLTID
jgi:hypothetical protein